MNKYLGTLVASALLTFGALTGSLAETATLLPNAVQQFFDNNGKPLATGTAGFYVPSTLTLKTVWTSADESVAQTNPVPLTLSGRPASAIYGSGIYRQIVKDKNGVVIWDALTAATDSGGGGVAPAFSEGVMVGTIIPWANMVLPAKYLYTAGQAISRATYPDLYTALTFSTSILCQSGIATITVSTDISDKVPIGTPVEFACFAPGTTVIAKSSGTLTMSTNATSTTSVAGVLFPWGNGNGSTTFNVPNINGRTIVGRDNMNGGAAGVLTSTYYKTPGGTGVNPDAVNAVAGNQSNTLLVGNLPPYTPAGTITNGAIAINQNAQINTGGNQDGGGGAGALVNAGGATITATQNTSTFAGTAAAGQISTPFSQIQPSVTADYIIKALPDDTPGGPGVTSIQGMTGAIGCSGGIVCTANNITFGTGTVNTWPLFSTGVGTPPIFRPISGADLPNPATTTLGGVFAKAQVSGQVIGGIDTSGNPQLVTSGTFPSADVFALAVGRQGATNPAFQVDASTALGITGIKVTAQSAGNGVNIDSIGETNVPLQINAAGAGTINLNTSGTGVINSFRDFNVLHDSNPVITFGITGATVGTLANRGTSAIGFATNTTTRQVQINHTASANRVITLTGSNGGNPTIGTSGGSLAVTPALVGAAAVDGQMAANSVKCNNTAGVATSIDCTVAQAAALSVPVLFSSKLVDFNTTNTDYAIPVVLPTGFTKYRLGSITIINSGTTASLTTATYGVWTGAAETGVNLVTSGTALSALTTNLPGVAGGFILSTFAVANFYLSSATTTIYFRMKTAQGAAASGVVVAQIIPVL